ncbi:MAG: hypothetical protein LBD22_02240 [Spirochaetaceae bacterium]|jgi:hypothetical protein|nr:hypothetical protein [Spirochaetaceae bacterium]
MTQNTLHNACTAGYNNVFPLDFSDGGARTLSLIKEIAFELPAMCESFLIAESLLENNTDINTAALEEKGHALYNALRGINFYILSLKQQNNRLEKAIKENGITPPLPVS